MTETMNATTPIERLKALAPRQHLSLGVMAANKPDDFALVMAAAGCAFGAAEACSERDVNERLRAWLEGPGTMLATDHVELRRWLVDNGVLSRDGYGRVYTRGAPRQEIADAMAFLAGHDVAAVIDNARSEDAARREARKAQWAKGQGTAP